MTALIRLRTALCGNSTFFVSHNGTQKKGTEASECISIARDRGTRPGPLLITCLISEPVVQHYQCYTLISPKARYEIHGECRWSFSAITGTRCILPDFVYLAGLCLLLPSHHFMNFYHPDQGLLRGTWKLALCNLIFLINHNMWLYWHAYIVSSVQYRRKHYVNTGYPTCLCFWLTSVYALGNEVAVWQETSFSFILLSFLVFMLDICMLWPNHGLGKSALCWTGGATFLLLTYLDSWSMMEKRPGYEEWEWLWCWETEVN